MDIILFILLQAFVVLLIYPLLLAAKYADEEMRNIYDEEYELWEENRKMESQRDLLRTIEREIEKGSVPARFEEFGFTKETYHMIESQAKLNQLLDYFFRTGEYAMLADAQVKSNIYMEINGKKISFRNAKSAWDRGKMENAVKLWIKRKHPSYDGDVYVENIRCFLSIPLEEIEKRKCSMNGEDTSALIFRKKHLEALYLQCLINRKEIIQYQPNLGEFSDTQNRIYRLENVDVLFQCLIMDQMMVEDGRVYVQFSTIYMLKGE